MKVGELIRQLSCFDKNLETTLTIFNVDSDEAFCYEIDDEMLVDFSEEENSVSIVLSVDTEELQRSFPELLQLKRECIN